MVAHPVATLISTALLNALAGASPPAAPPGAATPVAQQAPAAPEAAPAPVAEPPSRGRRAAQTVGRDFGNLYDLESFRAIGVALAAGGVLANTSADQEVQDWYGEDVRSTGTADFAEAVEVLGDDWVAPTFVLAGVAGELVAREPPGRGLGGWVRRTGRSALIGLPAVYYLQQMTGGNRPSDGVGSEWEPFDGSHGLSGHAFLGAVPFLTVARMSRNRVVDVLAVTASTFAGLGRIDSDEHYLSQVFLGWFLAWEATGAVADTERGAVREEDARAWTLRPVALPHGGGLHFTWRF